MILVCILPVCVCVSDPQGLGRWEEEGLSQTLGLLWEHRPAQGGQWVFLFLWAEWTTTQRKMFSDKSVHQLQRNTKLNLNIHQQKLLVNPCWKAVISLVSSLRLCESPPDCQITPAASAQQTQQPPSEGQGAQVPVQRQPCHHPVAGEQQRWSRGCICRVAPSQWGTRLHLWSGGFWGHPSFAHVHVWFRAGKFN